MAECNTHTTQKFRFRNSNWNVLLFFYCCCKCSYIFYMQVKLTYAHTHTHMAHWIWKFNETNKQTKCVKRIAVDNKRRIELKIESLQNISYVKIQSMQPERDLLKSIVLTEWKGQRIDTRKATIEILKQHKLTSIADLAKTYQKISIKTHQSNKPNSTEIRQNCWCKLIGKKPQIQWKLNFFKCDSLVVLQRSKNRLITY